MDNNVLINKKTFEIENNPELFICNKKIAYAVAMLNKKGYITKSSCEGHIEFAWHEIDDCDLDLLAETKTDDRFIILRVKKTGFDYLTPNMITSIYIDFKEKYQFKNLPKGFKLEKNIGWTIRKNIEYKYKDERRTIDDLEQEKDAYINILNKWVEQLPVNK